MRRERYKELLGFLAVARERSFTKAAAQLGISQSALSHTVRGLEQQLGLRLLTRTTRSVAPTEAGERLLLSLGPHFEQIEAQLEALTALREKPAKGRLARALESWCPPFPGYHLYYPSRRQSSPAFALLVEALRH
jgi:DNA-binding transcriptional LysR family regulator